VPDADEQAQRALECAYAYLNTRDRTVAEVQRRLEQRGIGEPAARAALAVLTDQGVLDDARFVRLFVEDKRGLEQWGSERIRRTLRERGVDRELIEQSLAAGEDSDATELERALAVLRRRFPDPPRDRRERDRALGVLLRKGYDGELALEALAAHARAPSTTAGEARPRTPADRFAPYRRRYYDAGSERTALGAEKHQQTS